MSRAATKPAPSRPATAAEKPRERFEEILHDLARRRARSAVPGQEPRKTLETIGAGAAPEQTHQAMVKRLAVEERITHIQRLAWAIDKLMVHELTTNHSNMVLCECVWTLGEMVSEQAELAEEALAAYANHGKEG